MTTTTRDPLCIYHGTCQDGFAAAWVVRKALKGNVEFCPGVHGEVPPMDLFANRDVYIVDFCYSPRILQKILNVAHHVRVLDHHVTAKEQYPHDLMLNVRTEDQLLLHFDMEHSGCMIAWQFFAARHPEMSQSAPKLIQHIEDRDLWRFNMPGTAEISAALFSYPYDFAVLDEFVILHEDAPLMKLRSEGGALIRKQAQDIATLLPLTRRTIEIGGYTVPIANMPITMVSDAGHALAVGQPFAACYQDTHDGWRNYALRSTEGGVDVSEIAKLYGGGGHKRAAGFRLRLQTLERLPMFGNGISEFSTTSTSALGEEPSEPGK